MERLPGDILEKFMKGQESGMAFGPICHVSFSHLLLAITAVNFNFYIYYFMYILKLTNKNASLATYQYEYRSVSSAVHCKRPFLKRCGSSAHICCKVVNDVANITQRTTKKQ